MVVKVSAKSASRMCIGRNMLEMQLSHDDDNDDDDDDYDGDDDDDDYDDDDDDDDAACTKEDQIDVKLFALYFVALILYFVVSI